MHQRRSRTEGGEGDDEGMKSELYDKKKITTNKLQCHISVCAEREREHVKRKKTNAKLKPPTTNKRMRAPRAP